MKDEMRPYALRRRAERRGDAIRMSLSTQLRYKAEQRRIAAAERAAARDLGISRSDFRLLADLTGIRVRAFDVLESGLKSLQREAEESCRLA